MDNVSWTCPGWVSVRPELYNINSFNVYVTKLNYPRIFIDTSSNNSSNNKSNKNTVNYLLLYKHKHKYIHQK